MDFFTGNVLRIDLSSLDARVEPLDLEWARLYLGGKGLLLRYLWDEMPRGVDPWAPENPVILATGPFAGTGVCTASRLVVGSKSPVTGMFCDSYAGGSFAPEMKFAGYDLIILTGEAPEPVVISISDSECRFIPARPRYWGLGTSEIEEALRNDLDPLAKVLSIGPAGENRIPWACLSTDQFHKAGRGGLGTLFGHKGVKAIAVRGTGAVSVGDAKGFLEYMFRLQSDSVLTDDNLWVHEEGTPILVDPINGAGALPTRNWSAGVFEDADKINSTSFLKLRTRNRACYQCALGCRQWHESGDVKGEGPEYETIAICGSNCGIGDIDALMQFNKACDELAMDTISTGSVVALAMDLTARGVHDFGMSFGDVDGYLAAPAQIALREGPLAELALGARALAARYGRPELAMEVKNLELPGYDPRAAFGMSLSYSTSDRGGCHMRAYPIADEILTGTLPPDSLEGKAAYVAGAQNFTSVKFSGILCEFWAISTADLASLYEKVWGRGLSEEELLGIGDRIWNLARLLNLREGAEPDALPVRLIADEHAHEKGPAAGKAIGAAAFAAALKEFYAIRGWDEAGLPTEAKLAELGVDVRL